MLVDQKMNDGIPVPFFGREAMTAPAVAELALKYDCPAWPVSVERLGDARFRITVYPKLDIPRTGDRSADVAETKLTITPDACAVISGIAARRPW